MPALYDAKSRRRKEPRGGVMLRSANARALALVRLWAAHVRTLRPMPCKRWTRSTREVCAHA